MQNVVIKVEGNIITITVDLSKNFGLSSSGKTQVVASTGGFTHINGVMVGLNVNKKK